MKAFFKNKGVRVVSISHLHKILLLAYADELVILADNPVIMNKILKQLSEYCRINDLELNERKTKIVIFKRGGHKNNVKYQSYYNKEIKIEVVSSYNYLGIDFYQSGLFCNTVENVIKKSYAASSATLAIINKIRPNSWWIINRLFVSMVSSVSLYASQVWSPRYVEEIEKVQNSFFKKDFLVSNNIPNYEIRLELGRPHMSVLIFKLALKWLEKILMMDGSRLPKVCFDRLKKLAESDKQSDDLNWISQIKHFFTVIKREEIWNNLNLKNLQENKESLLKLYKMYWYDRDRTNLMNSSSLIFYRHLHNQPFTQD